MGPDFIRELGPAASAVLVFLFVWNFIMPYIHRLLERRVQENCAKDRQIPFCVAEFGLIWPLVGVLGMAFAFGFAFTANSRICMLCANNPDNVRGFGGGFCAYTEELKEELRHDNSTNCTFVKESILGPGRRTWMQMSSVDQMSLTTQPLVRKFTGTKGIHSLSIAASNTTGSEVVTLLRLEQNSTTPVSPFNET